MNTNRWISLINIRPVLRLLPVFLVLLPILGFSTPLEFLPAAVLQQGAAEKTLTSRAW